MMSMWISLCSSCLGFTHLLNIGLCVLSNLGNFQPSLFQVLFQAHPLYLLFWDFNDMHIKPSCSPTLRLYSVIILVCLVRLGYFCCSVFQFTGSFLCPFSSDLELIHYTFYFVILFFTPKLSIWCFSIFLCWDRLFLCWSFLFFICFHNRQLKHCSWVL